MKGEEGVTTTSSEPKKKPEEPPIDIEEIKSKQKKSSDKFTTVEKPDTQSSGREDIQATKSSQITDELFKDRNREVIKAEVEKYKEIKEANRIEAAVKETTAPEDAEKDSKIPKAQKAVAEERPAKPEVVEVPPKFVKGFAGRISPDNFKDIELKIPTIAEPKTVAKMAEQYKAGDPAILSRPIAVVPDGKGGISIVEGQHRAAAAKKANVNPPVVVIADSRAEIRPAKPAKRMTAKQVDALAKKMWEETTAPEVAEKESEIPIVEVSKADNDLEISQFDVPGKDIAKQDSDGKGPFRSLLMMFGVSTIIGLVLPAISRAASSPVANQVSRGDIVGAGVSMLQAVGIGLGLIAGGIAIKYGVKAVRGWIKQRAVSTITEEGKAAREIAFRDAGEIKAGLVKAVEKELMVPSVAVSMDLTPTQASVMASRIVEEFLKGVIPVNEIEKEALIRAVTKVEIGTLRGEPVNFTEMVLGEVPGRENIQRALLEERGRTLEELLRELLRTDYMREVVYFYQGVLIPEGATLSRFEKEFLSQSLVLRTLELLHELAPEIGFKVAAETWARKVKNLREEYGAVLLRQLALPEKMQELERAVGEEIESARLELSVQRIIEAIRENRVEELPLPQKEIVLRAVMRAKIWNHDSSIWEVLEQVFGVVPGQVPPSRISGKEIKLTYMPQEKYERLEEEIAGRERKEIFIKSRAMVLVEDTGREKWQVEVILNGGYNTLSGLFYRAFHELIYAMILNVQGRLPVEEKVNRELAGLINYYLVAGGIFERLDRGVEYTLSREMIRFIREVPEKGLTEGIVPLLVKAMPALVSTASEISTYEPIAGYEIRPEVMDFEGTKVFVFDIRSLFNVKVRFGEVTVEPRSRAVFEVMKNIVKVAEKEGKGDKIKFAFVSNIRGLSKEVMEQMLIDYMLDYGLSPEVVGQIIDIDIDKDKSLILDRFTLKQTGRRISTKDVYDAVIRALAGGKAEKVSGIKVTILTDNQKRWRERIREVLWVILTPKKGEMLSTATGLVVAIEGQVSPWLKAFIKDNWNKKEAEKLLKIVETEHTFTVPATPVPRTYLDRMQTEKKIYRIQA
ncbi:hypothetical protein ES707_05056 [subsurface metagenome]